MEIRSPAVERSAINVQNHQPQLKVGHPKNRRDPSWSFHLLTWSVTERVVVLVIVCFLNDSFGNMGRRFIVSAKPLL